MRGKPNRPSRPSGTSREHPRVCGENPWEAPLASARIGTSPRMRGKLQDQLEQLCDRWNIPAYAGKTSGRFPARRWGQEHPRVCGENVVQVALGNLPSRNIPAYAGKTGKAGNGTIATAEHPRVCGENQTETGKRLWGEGTSPRMRGKPRPFSASITTWLEHPRVCGENHQP